MTKKFFSFQLICLLLFLGCSQTSRQLGLSFSKVRNNPSAACAGVPNSRQIQVNCGPGSGTNGYCKVISDSAPIYFVLVPNNSSGAFLDTNAGLLSNCTDLWNSIAGVTLPPSDVVGAFISGSASIESVSCTDVGGCIATPTSCVSAWDPTTYTPKTTAASIPNGSYLACGFIDTPALGSPPQAGLAAISGSTSFAPVMVSGTITLNSWVDY